MMLTARIHLVTFHCGFGTLAATALKYNSLGEHKVCFYVPENAGWGEGGGAVKSLYVSPYHGIWLVVLGLTAL